MFGGIHTWYTALLHVTLMQVHVTLVQVHVTLVQDGI